MLKPIEEVIKTVEKKLTLDEYERYNVIMYLEMLRDLMCDTVHYYGAYMECNISKGKKDD